MDSIVNTITTTVGLEVRDLSNVSIGIILGTATFIVVYSTLCCYDKFTKKSTELQMERTIKTDYKSDCDSDSSDDEKPRVS
jgi:hypothetical protein